MASRSNIVFKLLISSFSVLAKVIEMEEICAPESVSVVTFSPSTNNSDSLVCQLALKVDLGHDRGLLQSGVSWALLLVFGGFGAGAFLLEGPGPHLTPCSCSFP